MKLILPILVCLFVCSTLVAASYDEWSKSVSYPYSISSAQKEKLLQRYKEINGVISEPEAIRILGQPDYIIAFYSKGPNQEFKGNTFKYVIHKKHEEFVNEKHDQYITLFFNSQGKLTSMHPQNLPELQELRFE